MKKFTFRLMIAAAFAICFATACQKEPATDGIDAETASRIASLEEQLTTLQQTVASLTSAAEASQNELKKDLEKQKSDTEAKYAEITDRLEALEDTTDTAELIARIEALEGEVGDLSESFGSAIDELKKVIDSELDDLITEQFVKAVLAELRGEIEAEFEAETAVLTQEIESCQTAISSLGSSIMVLENQIVALQQLIAASNSVGRSEYDDFVRQINDTILVTGKSLSELQSLCSGFSGDQSIKSYIDNAVSGAVSALTSILDDYVLKATYDKFIAEYGAFKTDILAQINANREAVEACKNTVNDLIQLIQEKNPDLEFEMNEIMNIEERLAAMTSRVETLENSAVTLEQLNEQFDKQNEAFAKGVNDLIEEALADDGVISAAIAASAATLRNEYSAALEELTERMGRLEERVEDIESKLDEIMNRIQSLVYVPKTADGKIHIGATYIAQTDADGNETGARIELTPTKKLEYRVSPADLRDKLLALPLSSFSFYQEHVTRAEGSGMDEFHIVKIEEGNGPGEILITVNNEHDFTHEDLAVALCIKGTSANGVTTEFTSPYTTVSGDGRNIHDRFYMAKRVNGQWVASRDDNISYLMRYDDLTSTVSLSSKEYQVVYDNGEGCMTLEEAKQRFEWEVDLTTSTASIAGAYSNTLASGYNITPSNPNANRKSPVTVSLLSADTNNIGGKVSDKYSVHISDGTNTVELIPEVNLSLTVISTSYSIDQTQIVWNFDTWNSGRTTGATQYGSTFGTVSSAVEINDASDLSYLSDNDFNDIFVRNAVWTVNKESDATATGDLSARSAAAQSEEKLRRLQFTIGGYIYSEGKASTTGTTPCTTESVTLSGTTHPQGLVGTEDVTLTAVVNLIAPAARSVTVKQTLQAGASASSIFIFNIGDYITARDKIPAYTDDEVKLFFGSKTNVNLMFTMGRISNSQPWTSTDDGQTYSLPVEYALAHTPETGSYAVDQLFANPQRITPALQQTATFMPPADYYLNIPNGPKIPITGSVTVTKSE